MSKRRKNASTSKASKAQRRQRRLSHDTPTSVNHHQNDASAAAPPELLAEINEAAGLDHPLPLLQLASSLLAAMDPRSRNPFERHQPDAPGQADFVHMLMEAELPETSLLLAALRTLVGDELLSTRIRRSLLATYPTSVQQQYAAPVPYRAVELSHVLGDGDNVFIGARNDDGDEFTFLVYIDHNLGTLVKDAFASDLPLESLMAHMQSTMPNDGRDEYTLIELDLADARAKVDEAIELASITYPPLETETWPAERSLLEAVVRQAPSGGTGYVRPEYSDEQLAELTEDFFRSEYGRGLDNPDHRFLFESILWFGTDYGPGDPLRWSPPSVEILLVDWFPRKVVAPADDVRPLPALLRAFVRYSHGHRNIREDLTAQTLTAIDDFADEFQELISSTRRQGPEALLESVGALPPFDEADARLDERQAEIRRRMSELEELEAAGVEEIMLNAIRQQVGGAEQMEQLNDDPLPDEDPAWGRIPEDIHARVQQVLELCDRCCVELLDTDATDSAGRHEHRTAARRLLTLVAAGDPAIFRRKGAANTAAGAICWIIAKGNSDQQFGGMNLGTPTLLTSTTRRELIDMRNKYQAALRE